MLISCDKEEKWTQTLYKSRFLQTDYFIPTKSKVYANPSNGYYVVYLDGDSITLDNDSVRFKEIALEYGETGERIFEHALRQISKPYGIKSMKVYWDDNGVKKDVSDSFCIRYSECSSIISSGYVSEFENSVSSTVQSLTEHDLKWFSNKFYLHNKYKLDEVYTIVFSLENDEVFEVELKGW